MSFNPGNRQQGRTINGALWKEFGTQFENDVRLNREPMK